MKAEKPKIRWDSATQTNWHLVDDKWFHISDVLNDTICWFDDIGPTYGWGVWGPEDQRHGTCETEDDAMLEALSSAGYRRGRWGGILPPFCMG